MLRDLLQSAAAFLTSTELFLGVLWAGLAAVSVTLLVLIRTRWGQSQPLRKCFLLSLMAHLLLAGYATTVQVCSTGPATSGEPTMQVSLADGPSEDETTADEPSESTQPNPWDQFVDEDAIEPPADVPAPAEAPPVDEPQRAEPPKDDLPEDTAIADEPKPEPAMEPAEPHPALARQPEDLEAPEAERREAEPVSVPTEPAIEQPSAPTESEMPDRPTEAGAPSVLLDSPAGVPRATDEADSADAGQLVRDVIDSPTAVPHGQPAKPIAEPSPSADSSLTPIRRNTEETPASTATSHQPQPPRPPGDAQPDATTGGAVATTHGDSEIYRMRTSPDRSAAAQRQGATPESEAAVRAGLQWLAANQEPDGRWNAARHGAGREMRVDGQDRRGSGIRADTGVTGLALLALLAAGNTHQQGEYRDNVRRGLEFLIVSQRADGCLSGDADSFAAMYCHAMAAFALSEAYGMSRDPRLEPWVRRAIAYTVAAQDPRGGGWRYSPHSAGDTSQLGWQLMALRSAALAGIAIPESTGRGALRFLGSVSTGQHGGLASYRPTEQASRSMTAEALVCRQLLGMPSDSPTATEAADHLMAELPGDGQVNFYYWYYATLGLYQASGEHFSRWNEALQRELVSRQCDSGTLAGSWDPTTIWGGYGGRVYTTAMATLCLEVYYRYLPRYLETAGRAKTAR